MRIAFDLDDTLICYGGAVACEAATPLWAFPARWWLREPLRAGTTGLLRRLRDDGHEIWIYTSSYRSPRYLRLWFRLLGVRLGGVVTAEEHRRAVGPPGSCPRAGASKYPPAFRIDLLVDDRPGVAMEGARFGFDVLTVSLDDADWARSVLDGVAARGAAGGGGIPGRGDPRAASQSAAPV